MDDAKFQAELIELHLLLHKLLDQVSEGIEDLIDNSSDRQSLKESARRFYASVQDKQINLVMDKSIFIASEIVRRIGGTANDYCQCRIWGEDSFESCAHSLAFDWVWWGRRCILDSLGAVFVADRLDVEEFIGNLEALKSEELRIRTMFSREFALLTPSSLLPQSEIKNVDSPTDVPDFKDLKPTAKRRSQWAWDAPEHSISFQDVQDLEDHAKEITSDSAKRTQREFNFANAGRFRMSLANAAFAIEEMQKYFSSV